MKKKYNSTKELLQDLFKEMRSEDEEVAERAKSVFNDIITYEKHRIAEMFSKLGGDPIEKGSRLYKKEKVVFT